jgi:hypothetical protein
MNQFLIRDTNQIYIIWYEEAYMEIITNSPTLLLSGKSWTLVRLHELSLYRTPNFGKDRKSVV